MCHYINNLFMLVLGILLMVAIVSASPGIGGFTLSQATYDELNSYLVENHYNDPVAGIYKLEDLMHAEMEKAKKDPKVNNGVKIDALEHILMLANIADPKHPSCNEGAMKLVGQVEHAINSVDRTGHFAKKANAPIDHLEPIQSVIHSFISDHAKACVNVYPEMMKAKVSSLDHSKVSLVEKIFSGVVALQIKEEKQRHPKQTDSQALYNALIARPYKPAKEDSAIIYGALKEVSRNDPGNKCLLVSKDRLSPDERRECDHDINILNEKYLKKPCEYYIKELESIVEPAWHDFSYGMPIRSDKMEFYHSMALFSICTSVIQPH